MNTKIFKVNNSLTKSEADLSYSADVIKNGGLVVFPTETVYGLGADATNENAVKAIYEAKGRPSDNPLIIHIAKPEDAEQYTYTNNIFYLLAKAFMPGPLTVVLKAKDTIPMRTRGGLDTVAVRCPSNEIARKLISLSGVPIAAPSANLSGTPSPTNAKHVTDDMFGRVDVIIDGGDCEVGVESTIVKINDDDSITLLRPGKITLDDLKRVAENVSVANAVTAELQSGEVALSPGMKYKHYAPKSTLLLVDGSVDELIDYIKEDCEKQSLAIVCYSEDISSFSSKLPCAKCFDFGNKSNQAYQAQRLFSLLREIDKENFDLIYAPLPETDGIGLALYNRMIRAAAHKIIKLRR